MSRFNSILEAVAPDKAPSEIQIALNEYGLTVPAGMESFFREGHFVKSGMKFADIDKQQLDMGLKVELEHTTLKAIALKIALDHIAELKDYYTRLAKMEG